GARLVVLSMAWLTTLQQDAVAALKDAPDMDTFRYWLLRFWPLMEDVDGDADADADADAGADGTRIIVFANRCGIERAPAPGLDDAVYAGSSCVVGVRPRPQSQAALDGVLANVVVWDMLAAAETGVLYVDTDDEPKTMFAVRRSTDGE
ncbi:Carbon-nitrogen hydrolase, partial [Ascosphaera acerosa]